MRTSVDVSEENFNGLIHDYNQLTTLDNNQKNASDNGAAFAGRNVDRNRLNNGRPRIADQDVNDIASEASRRVNNRFAAAENSLR